MSFFLFHFLGYNFKGKMLENYRICLAIQDIQRTYNEWFIHLNRKLFVLKTKIPNSK